MITFSHTLIAGNRLRSCGTCTIDRDSRSRIDILRDDFAPKAHRSLAWPQQTADRLEHSRLAGAVGPDEADHFAFVDVERDALENVAGAVARDHVLENEERL